MMEKEPNEITPANLDVVVMPNGEVICLGKTVGWVRTLGPYLTAKEPECVCNGGEQGEGCVSIPHEPHCPKARASQ